MTEFESPKGKKCNVCGAPATMRVRADFALGRKLLHPAAEPIPMEVEGWACDLHGGGTDLAPAGEM